MSKKNVKQMTFRFSERDISDMKSGNRMWADSLRQAITNWHHHGAEFTDDDGSTMKPYTLQVPTEFAEHIDEEAKRLGKSRSWLVRKIWSRFGMRMLLSKEDKYKQG